ncbi:Transmembrane channel-like protein 8 [Triplophysa tibetana]|uniref:Transmembrane channel-like protein n=1 Tax=Triplophysa tibetana TaxID=1572043 RepID=A0A5A9NDE2_9TELE|nr:Transmembrane channel-like protein 8 [Triplophysa tibetana]
MMEEEEPGTPHFQRLISDESVSSVQSSESCDYHHTEIFAQLPSSQAHRQQQHDLHPDDERRMLESSVPPQALLVCMKIKRHIRSERAERWQQKHPAGSWDSWRQKQQITRRRVKEDISKALSGLLLWRHTLHKIEGQFGVGVKAYFVFLRYLFCLNVLYCVIIGGSVLTPTLMFTEKLVSNQTFGFKDIFVGSGVLEGSYSPVFHSFYTRGSLDFPCLNTPILFLLSMMSVLLLSIIMVVHRTGVGYKHVRLTGNRFSSNLSYKVFCGWDFSIQNEKAAALKHTFISDDLKMDLEEQKFHEDVQKRTIKHWIQLILLRVVLNILVLLLLAGSFILIHHTITVSQKYQNLDWIQSLLLEYLPPVTMTIVNYVLPQIFSEMSKFEDFSHATQLNLTLIRSIFLKLASLGIYLFFFIKSVDSNHKCAENAFGKEMYKLTVFNFLESFFSVFCVAYPRMLLVKRCLWLKQKLGLPQFDISSNVLDLVNSQTVTWVGVFYCPLLPAISAVRLLLLLYIKKFTLIHCCVRAQRIFRVASSSVLFHFTLMLGLFMSVIVLGVNINRFVPGGCGPFEGNRSVFNVTAECVETLPALAQSIISYVTSNAFAFALILAEMVILTSYMSRGRANSKAIERWKEMLVMCSSDKRFLAKKHNTMRRQKTPRNRHVQH